ncbi:MAG: hypothetical protein ACT6FF_00300 [Methanosarcinaceae archaeon]
MSLTSKESMIIQNNRRLASLDNRGFRSGIDYSVLDNSSIIRYWRDGVIIMASTSMPLKPRECGGGKMVLMRRMFGVGRLRIIRN